MTVKKKRRVWPLLLLFIIGLSIFSYPFLSDYYYRVEFTNEVASFGQGISELEAAEIKERMELAQAYNNVLNNKITPTIKNTTKNNMAFCTLPVS